MSYLPELRTSLVDAAHRQREIAENMPRPGRSANTLRWRPRGWRAVLLNVALTLAVAATGLTAAGVFQRGRTVGPGVPPSPTSNDGVAIPSSVRLLPLRVADPGGGPPWGLRILRTTRGLTCAQVGRVDFGTVGVLGQDGAFANDGRFHPLSENYLEMPFGCTITDARGNGFLNVFLQDAPASDLLGGPSSAAGGCHPADQRGSGPHEHSCPPADLRDVYYGLLGPDAVSITHLTASGGLVTSPTTESAGAYLVVLPHATKGCLVPDASQRFPRQCRVGFQGDTGGPALESGAVTAVTYRDGRTCHTPPPGSMASLRGGCPPVGFASPQTQRITPAQLATPISVRKILAKTYCAKAETVEPCGARTPRGFKRLSGGWPSLLVQISFTSRIAIPNGRSYYEVNLTMPHSRTCTTGGEGGPTNSDIHRGQRVITRMFIPYRCPGVVHGSVTYVPTVGPASSMPVFGLPGQRSSIAVGRFSFVMRRELGSG
jgi:hypothetical protein